MLADDIERALKRMGGKRSIAAKAQEGSGARRIC
jgi:hypothetical protein